MICLWSSERNYLVCKSQSNIGWNIDRDLSSRIHISTIPQKIHNIYNHIQDTYHLYIWIPYLWYLKWIDYNNDDNTGKVIIGYKNNVMILILSNVQYKKLIEKCIEYNGETCDIDVSKIELDEYNNISKW